MEGHQIPPQTHQQCQEYARQWQPLLPDTKGKLAPVHQLISRAVYPFLHIVQKTQMLHVVEDPANSIGCCT